MNYLRGVLKNRFLESCILSTPPRGLLLTESGLLFPPHSPLRQWGHSGPGYYYCIICFKLGTKWNHAKSGLGGKYTFCGEDVNCFVGEGTFFLSHHPAGSFHIVIITKSKTNIIITIKETWIPNKKPGRNGRGKVWSFSRLIIVAPTGGRFWFYVTISSHQGTKCGACK